MQDKAPELNEEREKDQTLTEASSQDVKHSKVAEKSPNQEALESLEK